MLLKLILVLLFFFASALIAGSEVAYFRRGSPSALGRTRAFGLLVTILLLNNMVNSYISSLVADIAPSSGILVGIIVSISVTVFAEFIPKRLALSYPHFFIRATEFVFTPLSTLFSIFKVRVEPATAKLTTYAVMQAVVDIVRNSDMGEEERLYIAKILYAIHGKGYAILYPLSESPLLRFEMSVGEALKLLEGYDRPWVPIYHITPNEITHMLKVDVLKMYPPDEPIMDLPKEEVIYVPIIGNFVKLLETIEKKGFAVLVDEFGNVKGFSYKKDVEIWLLSYGNVLPIRTSLLEFYIITGKEIGPINWDLADLFQHHLSRAAEEGDSLTLGDLKLTVTNDIFVRIETVGPP